MERLQGKVNSVAYNKYFSAIADVQYTKGIDCDFGQIFQVLLDSHLVTQEWLDSATAEDIYLWLLDNLN